MKPTALKGVLDSLRASMTSEMKEWRVVALGRVRSPHGLELHTYYADVKALLLERRDRTAGKL